MAGGNGYSGTSQIPEVNQFLPGQVPTDIDARNRLLNYQRDIGIPKHRVRWNWLFDVPVGKGKPILGNAGNVLNRIVGCNGSSSFPRWSQGSSRVISRIRFRPEHLRMAGEGVRVG